MRFDKYTTKFQQAFADAQSLAIGKDNPYIEPQHLLLALMDQQDGGTASLLSKGGINVRTGVRVASTVVGRDSHHRYPSRKELLLA